MKYILKTVSGGLQFNYVTHKLTVSVCFHKKMNSLTKNLNNKLNLNQKRKC